MSPSSCNALPAILGDEALAILCGVISGVGLRQRVVGLLLLGLAGAVPACSPVKPFVPDPSPIPPGQGRLWRVGGLDTETTSASAPFSRPAKRVLKLPQAAPEPSRKAGVLAREGIATRGPEGHTTELQSL